MSDDIIKRLSELTVPQEIEKTKSIILNLFYSQVELVNTKFTNFQAYKSKTDTKVAYILATAKPLAQDSPIELAKYASFCYNFSLKFFYARDYKPALNWISESVDVYQLVPNYDTTKLAKFLEVQSEILYLAQNFEMAYKAILKCNHFHASPKTKSIQLRLELQNGQKEASDTFSELVQMKPPIEALLLTLEFIVTSKHGHLLLDVLPTLLKVYSSPVDIVLIRFAFFEIFLFGYKDTFSSGGHLEFVLDQIQNGSVSVPKEHLQRMQNRLWQIGKDYVTQNQHASALFWFQCSFRLCNPTDYANRAKSLRFIGKCHLECKEVIEARVAIANSLDLVPNSLQGLCLMFRISLLDKSVEEASKVLSTLTSHEEFTINMYMLLAHHCYESQMDGLTIQCLEKLVEVPNQKNICEIVHTMVQLSLKNSNFAMVIRYCEILIEKVKFLTRNEIKMSEMEWFKAQTWNLGNSCGRSNPLFAYNFYKLSLQFMELCESSIKNSTLMVQSLLYRLFLISQMYYSQRDAKLLHQGVKDCEEAKMFLTRLCDSKGNRSIDCFEEIHHKNLILIQEFRFKLELEFSDSQLRTILEQCSKESVCAKVFVSFGCLAFECEKKRPEIAQEALKKALFVYLNEPNTNLIETLRCYIRLIQIHPKPDSTIGFFEDLQKIVKNFTLKEEAEEHVKWIISNAWNTGVCSYQAMNLVKAEQWMKIAHNLSLNLKDSDDLRVKIQESYPRMLDLLKKNEQDKRPQLINI
jgi:tetratricopeptide (TPR) repeat protein